MQTVVALVALVICSAGCSIVKDFEQPPFPCALIHHARAVGFEAAIPNQAGGAVAKFRFGFFSDSWEAIPCSTNQIFIAPIADTFKLGNEISLSPTTTIAESLATGTNPPTPNFSLFHLDNFKPQ